MDARTESVAPAVLMSERTWTESEIVEVQVKQADRDPEVYVKYSKEPLQQYLNENSILYIDPDKKRTDSWLSRTRLQLPFGENRYGPIRKIAYVDGKVKAQSPKNMANAESTSGGGITRGATQQEEVAPPIDSASTDTVAQRTEGVKRFSVSEPVAGRV